MRINIQQKSNVGSGLRKPYFIKLQAKNIIQFQWKCIHFMVYTESRLQ